MSEQTENQVDESPDTGEAQPAKEYSAIEQRAMEMGWRPLEEFNGDEADFVDAKEFVGRKPLFDKIDVLGRTLKQTQATQKQMAEHLAKVQQAAYDKAIADLKAQRQAAVAEGDLSTADDLNDKIQEQKAEKAAVVKEIVDNPAEPPAIHPVLQAWKARNPWYESQEHMQIFADKVAVKLNAKGLVGEDLLKEVEKQVREEFPNKFRNPNKDRTSAVESGSGKGARAAGKEDYSLTAEERRVMNAYVKQGLMTEKEYIEQLKLVK